MPVRVTQTMLNNNMLRNLSSSMGRMDKLQEQLSSGRKISRPSDDPVIATRGMFYRSSLIENEQFQRNVDEAQSWMELSDKSLEEANSVLQRVRELLVYSGDGGLEEDSLKSIAAEISQIKTHLGNIANQTISGRYIFAGTDTKNPPYDYAKGQFVNTNNAEIRLEMNKQIFLPINVSGQAVFNFPDNANNIFNILDNIITDLQGASPTNSEVSGDFSDPDKRIVTLTFKEAMDPATLVKENFSSDAGGEIVSIVPSADNKSVKITFTNPLGDADKVTIGAGVTNGAGTSISSGNRTIATTTVPSKPAADFLDDLDHQIDNLLAERATLGARLNRIELIQERLGNEEVNISKLMSDNEDADVAEVITNLKTQENVHRAALGAGARIIQPSLLDFLR